MSLYFARLNSTLRILHELLIGSDRDLGAAHPESLADLHWMPGLFFVIAPAISWNTPHLEAAWSDPHVLQAILGVQFYASDTQEGRPFHRRWRRWNDWWVPQFSPLELGDLHELTVGIPHQVSVKSIWVADVLDGIPVLYLDVQDAVVRDFWGKFRPRLRPSEKGKG